MPAKSKLLICCWAGLWLAGCAHFEDRPLSPASTAEQLEGRSLADPQFRSFLEANLKQPAMAWPRTNFDFSALTLAAFYFHPNLDLARAQWAVAQGGTQTAGARPNPVLALTPGYSANPPRNVSPWFPMVTLDVPLETAGKRRHRIARAQGLSEAARLGIAVVAWQVRSGVRAALVEYAAANRRVALLRESESLQQRLVDLLEQRLAAGAAASLDVVPARIAMVRSRGELAQAQRLAAEARGRIAESVGLPLRAIAGLEFEFDLGQALHPELLQAAARMQALLSRADILAGLADYAAAQSALQLEVARQYPDLHLNPGYQYDQGENKWQLGLSVELPVLNRNQGPIAEAKARRDEAATRFLALQVRVLSEIDRALLQQAAAAEQLRQIDELIQVQRQRVTQVEQALAAGAADQLDLAAARVELDVTQLTRLDAIVRQQQAAGLLEDALQQPFDSLATVEMNPKPQFTKEKP